jgi:excisionase family DNA binding protein
MSMFEETYLKPSTIAARLDVHRSHVYKLIKDGTLPHIRIGKAVRVPTPALEAYLRSQQNDIAIGTPAVRDEDRTMSPALMRGEIESRLAGFEERTGQDPAGFLEAWKSGVIPDTPDNAELAIDALALRAVLQRATIPA